MRASSRSSLPPRTVGDARRASATMRTSASMRVLVAAHQRVPANPVEHSTVARLRKENIELKTELHQLRLAESCEQDRIARSRCDFAGQIQRFNELIQTEAARTVRFREAKVQLERKLQRLRHRHRATTNSHQRSATGLLLRGDDGRVGVLETRLQFLQQRLNEQQSENVKKRKYVNQLRKEISLARTQHSKVTDELRQCRDQQAVYIQRLGETYAVCDSAQAAQHATEAGVKRAQQEFERETNEVNELLKNAEATPRVPVAQEPYTSKQREAQTWQQEQLALQDAPETSPSQPSAAPNATSTRMQAGGAAAARHSVSIAKRGDSAASGRRGRTNGRPEAVSAAAVDRRPWQRAVVSRSIAVATQRNPSADLAGRKSDSRKPRPRTAVAVTGLPPASRVPRGASGSDGQARKATDPRPFQNVGASKEGERGRPATSSSSNSVASGALPQHRRTFGNPENKFARSKSMAMLPFKNKRVSSVHDSRLKAPIMSQEQKSLALARVSSLTSAVWPAYLSRLGPVETQEGVGELRQLSRDSRHSRALSTKVREVPTAKSRTSARRLTTRQWSTASLPSLASGTDANTDSLASQIEWFRSCLEKVRMVTGVADIETLTELFLEEEKQNFSQYAYSNELCVDASNVLKALSIATSELADLKNQWETRGEQCISEGVTTTKKAHADEHPAAVSDSQLPCKLEPESRADQVTGTRGVASKDLTAETHRRRTLSSDPETCGTTLGAVGEGPGAVRPFQVHKPYLDQLKKRWHDLHAAEEKKSDLCASLTRQVQEIQQEIRNVHKLLGGTRHEQPQPLLQLSDIPDSRTSSPDTDIDETPNVQSANPNTTGSSSTSGDEQPTANLIETGEDAQSSESPKSQENASDNDMAGNASDRIGCQNSPPPNLSHPNSAMHPTAYHAENCSLPRASFIVRPLPHLGPRDISDSLALLGEIEDRVMAINMGVHAKPGL
eukprot:GHVT01015838.1.p1 GENE.GHVT01015838.1~~GHVT01015838.1.p1  ORF type:complete len:960 (+),score=146.46 GHVT01015838.1:2826-5705(+)